jgi:nucleotide-binding universal stress UspA family protein
VSDLLIIGRPDAHNPATEEIFEAAIYTTGCMTMLVPDRSSTNPLDHVLIAWDGSIQAARAVAGAMPMLETAKRISVFSVPENSKALYHHLGLIEHLERHDIRAEWVEPSSSSNHLGITLANTASQEKASMIVMGAYSHNRIHQAFLGSVTQHMVTQAEIPIVMMH